MSGLVKHVERHKRKIKIFWQSQYRPAVLDETELHVASDEPENSVNTSDKILREIFGSTVLTTSHEDELDKYFVELPIDNFDLGPTTRPFRALQWWCQSRQRQKFLYLYCYAIDLLSIPPQSSEIERVFSECKGSVTQERNRLNIETLDQLQRLRSVLRNARRVDGQDEVNLDLFLDENRISDLPEPTTEL